MGRAKQILEGFKKEDVNEAVTVSKVSATMGKYEKTAEKLLKEVDKYVNGKFQRRLESDYAGDEKKLKEIASQIMDSTEMLEDSLKEIKKIVG